MTYGQRKPFSMDVVETYSISVRENSRKDVNFRVIRYAAEKAEYVAVQKYEAEDGKGGAWLLDAEVENVIVGLAMSQGDAAKVLAGLAAKLKKSAA